MVIIKYLKFYSKYFGGSWEGGGVKKRREGAVVDKS